MVEDKDITERVRLVEADLALTNEFIKGVIAVSAALRGSAITLWVALLGFAFSQKVAELALLAVGIAVLFAIIDGYHGWLYAEALKHARSIEKLLGQYYNAISRYRDEPSVLVKFRGALRAHRYGPYRSLPAKFRVRNLADARPGLIYRLAYPALVVVAVLAFFAVRADSHADHARVDDPPACRCGGAPPLHRNVSAPPRRPHPAASASR